MNETRDDSKQYREIDIDSLQKILEPLEAEIRMARQMVDPEISNEKLEDYLVESMSSLIFDTLDRFPDFEQIVDYLEERCNRLGVSMYADRHE